jgi:hypothetical protein
LCCRIGYFDKVLLQNPGTFVNTQLLQTLVLLFDNIKTPTSIWFLLSNNHMNCIVTHAFDFDDEEVLAYYISFLRSLSMRLNKDTIHFFRNEHLRDFPLYIEALRFFNHRESMVRVAVRTLTLNCYRASMSDDVTLDMVMKATPYFSNLFWVIGSISLEMNKSLTHTEADYKNRGQFEFFVAEHLDHFHYLNDVLDLNSAMLSTTMIETAMNSLIVPLYVFPLADTKPAFARGPKAIDQGAAMFLLAHIFLLFEHPSLINSVAATLLLGNPDMGAAIDSEDGKELGYGLNDLAAGSVVKITPTAAFAEPVEFFTAAGIGVSEVSVRSISPVLLPDAGAGVGGGTANPMAALLSLNTIEGRSHSLSFAEDDADGSGAFATAAGDRTASGEYGLLGDAVAAGDPIGDGEVVDASQYDELEPVAPAPNAGYGLWEGPAADVVGTVGAASVESSDSPPILEAGADTPASVEDGNAAVDGSVASPDAEPAVAPIVMPYSGVNHCFRDTIYGYLCITADDVKALLSLLLIYSLMMNRGIYNRILASAGLVKPPATAVNGEYNKPLMDRVLSVITAASNLQEKSRLITLQLSIKLVQDLAMRAASNVDFEEDEGGAPAVSTPRCLLTPEHFEVLKGVRDAVIAQLKEVYLDFTERNPEARESFLDSFEDEFRRLQPIKVPLVMSQATILLTPTASPIPGVQFNCRLPGNTRERTRKAIQIYMLFRKFYLDLVEQKDTLLPLRQPSVSIQPKDSLDLNGSDLIVCNVVSKGRTGQMIQVRRFLMVDRWRLVLIENDNRKPGWGIVRFVADLNNVFVVSQAFHTRSLQISIIQPPSAYNVSQSPLTVFSGRFIFDDHIRCVTARQYLDQGRVKLREEKLNQVERMLCIAKPKHTEGDVAAALAATAAAAAAAAASGGGGGAGASVAGADGGDGKKVATTILHG